MQDDDEQDGLCDPDSQPTPTPDRDVDGIVLFADIEKGDIDGIERRIEEYEKLFHKEKK